MGSTYNYSETDGKFISIEIEATNVGKDRKFLNSISLFDREQRRFELDLMNRGSYPIPDLYDEGLKPGFSKKYNAVFEVAKASSGFILMFFDHTTKSTAVIVPLGL